MPAFKILAANMYCLVNFWNAQPEMPSLQSAAHDPLCPPSRRHCRSLWNSNAWTPKLRV